MKALRAIFDRAHAQPKPEVKVETTLTVSKRVRLNVFQPATERVRQQVQKAVGKRPPMECLRCQIGSDCPEYEEGEVCAFNEEFAALDTRNKEEVMALQHEVVNSTKERWRRQVYAEQRIGGGAPMPETSRLAKDLLEQTNMLYALDNEEQSLTISSNQSGNENILLKLFGGPPAAPVAIPVTESHVVSQTPNPLVEPAAVPLPGLMPPRPTIDMPPDVATEVTVIAEDQSDGSRIVKEPNT